MPNIKYYNIIVLDCDLPDSGRIGTVVVVVGGAVVEVGVVAGRPVLVVIRSVELVVSGTSRFVKPGSGPSTLYNSVRIYQINKISPYGYSSGESSPFYNITFNIFQFLWKVISF